MKGIGELMTFDTVELRLHRHLSRRVAAYRERVNVQDPEMELSWTEALIDALETGLEVSEREAGLFASVTNGKLYPLPPRRVRAWRWCRRRVKRWRRRIKRGWRGAGHGG